MDTQDDKKARIKRIMELLAPGQRGQVVDRVEEALYKRLGHDEIEMLWTIAAVRLYEPNK